MSYISNKLLIKCRSFVLWHTERTVDKIKRRMPAPKPFWILINPHIRILIHLPQISNIAFQSKLYVTNIQGGIIMEAVVMYKYIHNERDYPLGNLHANWTNRIAFLSEVSSVQWSSRTSTLQGKREWREGNWATDWFSCKSQMVK